MRARQHVMRCCADTYVRNKPWHSVGAPPPSGYLLAYCSIYVDNSYSVCCRRAISVRKPASFTESNEDNKYASAPARLWPQGFFMRHRV